MKSGFGSHVKNIGALNWFAKAHWCVVNPSQTCYQILTNSSDHSQIYLRFLQLTELRKDIKLSRS